MFRKKALKFYKVCNREKSRLSTLALLIFFALAQKFTSFFSSCIPPCRVPKEQQQIINGDSGWRFLKYIQR